ncbi:hypothetical protein [Gluconobacter oxydans]|uniref:hypothetical protein n=1 Tax=Gluconobacter oxydans TaxID=442 RepID=UPI001CD822B1|nr:hypothetical protein [Gluconobacter oxydans]
MVALRDDQEEDGCAKKDTGEVVVLYDMASPVMPLGLLVENQEALFSAGPAPCDAASNQDLSKREQDGAAHRIGLYIKGTVLCNHVEWQTCLSIFVMNLDHPA